MIIRYVRPLWTLALLAPVSVLLETWAELSQPQLMSIIVDHGILGSEPGIIVPTGVKMLIFLLLGVGGGLFSIFAAGRVAYRLGADMRRDVYARAMRMSFADIDRIEVPSLITRLTDDVNRVQSVVQQSMRLLFRAPLMFIGSVVMALMIDVDISVIIVGIMILSFGLVLVIMKRTYAMFLGLQTRKDSFTRKVQELLSGVRVTKAYTNESLEEERFGEANSALTAQAIGVGKVMACMMPIVSFVLNMGVVLIIYFGAAEVEIGNMKVGGIMAAINYMAQIQIAIMMAQHVIMGITQARASVNRINEVLSTPTEQETDCHTESLPFKNGDIELRGVSFSYPGENTARVVDNISLTIRRGQTLAIMGETGSGKTTLVNLIARFYDPTEGQILIGGQDIKTIDRQDLRRHIAVAMQTPLLFGGSIRANMAMARPDASDHEMMEAAEAADIASHIASMPDGLDSNIEQGGRNLSGGQRQRLSIARAILAQPDILILDDTLSALDTLTESRVRARLAAMPATKIIISQRVSSFAQADLIVVLSSGRAIAIGTHAELMQSCATYRETYNSQTR